MVEPCRNPSLLEALKRDQLHMKDIQAVLRSLKRRFGKEGIPFAVIGGLAVRQHGHLRFTEDIDLLTTLEGLRGIHEIRKDQGLGLREPERPKRLVDLERRVPIDVVTAGQHAGSQASPIVYPEPSGPGFTSVDGILYPTLEKLIEYKIASHIWGKRLQDLADAVKLIQANKLQEAFGARLHPAVQPKFAEALRAAREEIDIE